MSEIYCTRCKKSFMPTEPDTHHFYMCPHCSYMNENPLFKPRKTKWTQGYQKTHTGRRSVEGT